MLHGTTLSVKEIAKNLHFESEFHFSKLFRRRPSSRRRHGESCRRVPLNPPPDPPHEPPFPAVENDNSFPPRIQDRENTLPRSDCRASRRVVREFSITVRGVELRSSQFVYRLDTADGLRGESWQNRLTGKTVSLCKGPEVELEFDAAEALDHDWRLADRSLAEPADHAGRRSGLSRRLVPAGVQRFGVAADRAARLRRS